VLVNFHWSGQFSPEGVTAECRVKYNQNGTQDETNFSEFDIPAHFDCEPSYIEQNLSL